MRALGVEPATERELASTPEDLQILIAQSEEGGAIEPEEADMLEGVFGLQESLTRDIMTPRPEVTTLLADVPVRAAPHRGARHPPQPLPGAERRRRAGHRPPQRARPRRCWRRARTRRCASSPSPALFVPETQPVDDLLRQLQARRASLAVVLDEYGDFAGVVDRGGRDRGDRRARSTTSATARAAVDEQPDGRLIVRGHVPLEDLADHGVELVDDTVTSVGGLVFTRLGRLPRTGDSVDADGWRLTVEATRAPAWCWSPSSPPTRPRAQGAPPSGTDESGAAGRPMDSV